MSQTDENNLTPQNINRRNFLRRGGTVALLSALPGFAAKATAAVPVPTPVCPPNSPILLELLRISNLPDSRTVTEALATIFTSPEMISLPTYFLNTGASSLSGFQKDAFRTYLKLAANPLALKSLLTGGLTPTSIALRGTLTSSPSYLTAIAAAAEIKAVPSLTSQIDTGIQEFIAGLSTPLPVVPPTGIPALDTVLAKVHTLSQTTPYTNVSHALLGLVQRSDFPAFVKGLNPSDLVRFIPFSTRMGLQLPIDTPDDTFWGSFWATIVEAVNESVAE